MPIWKLSAGCLTIHYYLQWIFLVRYGRHVAARKKQDEKFIRGIIGSILCTNITLFIFTFFRDAQVQFNADLCIMTNIMFNWVSNTNMSIKALAHYNHFHSDFSKKSLWKSFSIYTYNWLKNCCSCKKMCSVYGQGLLFFAVSAVVCKALMM